MTQDAQYMHRHWHGIAAKARQLPRLAGGSFMSFINRAELWVSVLFKPLTNINTKDQKKQTSLTQVQGKRHSFGPDTKTRVRRHLKGFRVFFAIYLLSTITVKVCVFVVVVIFICTQQIIEDRSFVFPKVSQCIHRSLGLEPCCLSFGSYFLSPWSDPSL